MVTIIVDYTRSLRRRFGAFVIDLLFMTVFGLVMTYPFANSLDSRFRGGFGIVHYNSCADGQAYNVDGTPLSMEGWQRVVICDQLIDFFFPARTATFVRQSDQTTASGMVYTYTETVSLNLDGQNKVVVPIDLSSWLCLLFVAVSIASENLKGRTPGKYILGLAVENAQGGLPSLKQSCIRNLIKHAFIVISSIAMIWISHFGQDVLLPNMIAPDNKVVMPISGSAFLGWGLTLSLTCAVVFGGIWLSILIPWRKAGRAIYDRLAGTYVIRTSG